MDAIERGGLFVVDTASAPTQIPHAGGMLSATGGYIR